MEEKIPTPALQASSSQIEEPIPLPTEDNLPPLDTEQQSSSSAGTTVPDPSHRKKQTFDSFPSPGPPGNQVPPLDSDDEVIEESESYEAHPPSEFFKGFVSTGLDIFQTVSNAPVDINYVSAQLLSFAGFVNEEMTSLSKQIENNNEEANNTVKYLADMAESIKILKLEVGEMKRSQDHILTKLNELTNIQRSTNVSQSIIKTPIESQTPIEMIPVGRTNVQDPQLSKIKEAFLRLVPIQLKELMGLSDITRMLSALLVGGASWNEWTDKWIPHLNYRGRSRALLSDLETASPKYWKSICDGLLKKYTSLQIKQSLELNLEALSDPKSLLSTAVSQNLENMPQKPKINPLFFVNL